MAPVVPTLIAPTERDLRLDLFRGLALWLIFLDHVPNNIVAWFTIRNYGFSDATEIFIFISGYTAAFVYGRAMVERGFVVAGARIWKRSWQIYVAHVFLFAIYIAEIAYVASSFENPLYAEEMNALDFLKNPDVTIIQALLLKFKPANMDVLPLYIVSADGVSRCAVVAHPQGVACACAFRSGLRAGLGVRPEHRVLSNRALVFQSVRLAASVRIRRLVRARRCDAARAGVALAGDDMARGRLLAFAFAVTMTWYFPRLAFLVPHWLGEWMYPIDKTNLDVLRFAHFLALAALTVRFIPRDWPALQSPWLRPAIICGQHSLEIFCLGRVPGVRRAFRDG